jgi:steroid delta-isomerase-like uncharacterized protein
MSDQNEKIVRHAYEDGINQGDVQLHIDAFAPGYVNHFGGRDLDAEQFRKVYEDFRAGFSDLHTTIELIFSDGDHVAVRHRYEGTHDGTYMGVPPTGRRVLCTANDLYRMEDGWIVEEWSEFDMFALLRQIGVIPGGH